MTTEATPVKRPLSRKKKILFTVITLIFTLLVCTLFYLGSVLWRSNSFYKKPVRWFGSSYQADKDYGYFPKSFSIATHVLRTGERVPVRFDRHGFRVPMKKQRFGYRYKTKILFLGCSFTQGYSVPAEKTFAYLAAKELNARCLNAGVSGQGLSQMVLRARKEIPRFKPQYVVVQYSPWLVNRSQRFYKPTDYGKTPGPYFYESNGNVLIHPPVFTTKNFELPIAKYAGKSLLAFTWHVGIPLYLHDDYYVLLTSIKRLLGILPRPAISPEAIVRFAYTEIQRVCRIYGAQMVVLKLYAGLNNDPTYGLENLGIPVIDTLEPLASQLPERTKQAWEMEYAFTKGNPPRLVDIHPNANAHRIIAQTIVERISAITKR